jgi:hypothetical protein
MEKLEALAGQAGVAVMGGHDGMGEGVFDEFDIIVAKDDFVLGCRLISRPPAWLRRWRQSRHQPAAR